MIYPEVEVENFIKRLKENEFFKDFEIIKSFDNKIKPTIMDNCVIAVKFCDVECEKNSIGELENYGKFSISAKVFIPFGIECNFIKIMDELFKSIDNFNITGVKAFEPKRDRVTECFVFETIITFNGGIVFGGM